MKSSYTADSEMQKVLNSFMQALPETQNQVHSKKVKVTTINPQTGQPMTVEMEQTTHAMEVGIKSSPQGVMQGASDSILAKTLPGASFIEKIIAGHISYLIIPVCGIIIAWSYNQMSGGHALLGTAILFFTFSIGLELVAKLMHFPEIDKKLDEKLQGHKIRLKSKVRFKEWAHLGLENLKASHLKHTFQWLGIGLAFLGCLLMLTFFLGKTTSLAGLGNTSVPAYNVNQGPSSFSVR
jgi:hypothetical protein